MTGKKEVMDTGSRSAHNLENAATAFKMFGWEGLTKREWASQRRDDSSGRLAHHLVGQRVTDDSSLPPRFRHRQNKYFCTKAYVNY